MKIVYVVINEHFIPIKTKKKKWQRFETPLAIFECRDDAKKYISILKQRDADNAMDWLDVCKELADTPLFKSYKKLEPIGNNYYKTKSVRYYPEEGS